MSANRYELLKDDEPFGLSRGDILLCVPYWVDPGSSFNPEGKLTVIARESDGFDPKCNVYWSQVRQVRQPQLAGFKP